ncbi:hypothetical protein [Micromonospora sp. LH3U1]|uniref:hypothetical protein n=1 Tax=Micromonospora sp. LH3U1 TaxID=3018339 RepID=UPI002349F288|nr:hypothetical protein [Micromonospora sp. LH3U1]WCN82302.1 hypothetical protein PCA76_04245 [Micromonospora sp. LH3U1]
MIERGTGRTSGLTDWQLMDVNNMWACLQDHDTTNHWKQVAGWRKVCDLAQTHLGRLQEYRRGLARAWPPETSAASTAYLAELDELIGKVQRTHDAAAANYTALSAATQAIGTTRAALRKIHEEYATKFQQKQAYESIAADPKAVMGNRATQAPVTDVELERLNAQARAMMFNLSGELQQAQATLQKPPPSPRVNPGIDQSDPDVYGGTSVAPVIPPVVPVPLPPASTTRPSAAASQVGTSSTSLGVGPVLGGAGSVIASGPITPVPPGATPLTPPSPTPGFGAPPIPPVISARGDISQAPRSRPHATDLPASNTGSKGNPSAQPRPMPPGGLIGGMPGMGLGQPGASAGQPRRINPVGGLIGGGGAGTGPTGGAGSRPGGGRGSSALHGISPFGTGSSISGSTGASPGGIASARPDVRAKQDDEKRRWDPDRPWDTDEGVTPIVRPPKEEGPIDPGPAIGLDH